MLLRPSGIYITPSKVRGYHGGPEEEVDCRVAISCELKHSIFRGKLPKEQETLNRKDGAVHGTLTCLLPRKIVHQMVTNKYYRERKSV